MEDKGTFSRIYANYSCRNYNLNLVFLPIKYHISQDRSYFTCRVSEPMHTVYSFWFKMNKTKPYFFGWNASILPTFLSVEHILSKQFVLCTVKREKSCLISINHSIIAIMVKQTIKRAPLTSASVAGNLIKMHYTTAHSATEDMQQTNSSNAPSEWAEGRMQTFFFPHLQKKITLLVTQPPFICRPTDGDCMRTGPHRVVLCTSHLFSSCSLRH